MYGKCSSSSLVSILNEVKTDLWLSSTYGADNSVILYEGFQGHEFKTVLVVCLHVPISLKSSNAILHICYNALLELT